MPIYSYKCLKCECVFEMFHSMSETPNVCKRCKAEGHLQKQVPRGINTPKAGNVGKPKAGSLVNQYLKDVKQEVKEEKERLRSQESKK